LSDPHIHVGVTHKFRDRSGTQTDITINLSAIPSHSSDGLIQAMMGRAHAALDLVINEVETRAAAATRPVTVDAAAFVNPADPACSKCGDTEILVIDYPAQGNLCASCHESLGAAIQTEYTETVTHDPTAPMTDEDRAAEIERISSALAQSLAQIIPTDEQVRTGGNPFGIYIPYPPAEWLDDPISEINGSGTGPGQLTAINAALSSVGYGGKMRHAAVQAILDAYGPIHGRPVTQVTSTKQLSKAEAHIVLSWLDQPSIESLTGLLQAIAKADVPCIA
jgi:hypothetical protein